MAIYIYYDSGSNSINSANYQGLSFPQNGGSTFNANNWPASISSSAWTPRPDTRFTIYIQYNPVVIIADGYANPQGVKVLPPNFSK